MPEDEYSSSGINYLYYENSWFDFFMETGLRYHPSKTKDCSKNRHSNLQTRPGTQNWENGDTDIIGEIKQQYYKVKHPLNPVTEFAEVVKPM